MNRIAIIGSGPTGIYTLQALLREAADTELLIVIYEREEKAGVGMPYSDADNSRLMLANIASIEIPPLALSYLDWLKQQDPEALRRQGVDPDGLHERQFLPRILLGAYFRDQFLFLVEQGRRAGFRIEVHESCEVTDLEATDGGIRLWTESTDAPLDFDLAVIATGHVWPDAVQADRHYFPSPWSGLLETTIPPCRVGIMGTSLSAIDAAMAVVAQHGSFVRGDREDALHFEPDPASRALHLTLMSRSGILPEADFYCPIPYEPLEVATASAIEAAIHAGEGGLLDRVFALVSMEIQQADPAWSERIGLASLTVDTFADAYFQDRQRHDPFRWAAYNLEEVERNKQKRHTVPWRYAILRLHEVVQDIVPHLNDADRQRFRQGLGKVFIDNYAAIPPESIRRLLALREAGLIDVIALGPDYRLEDLHTKTRVQVGENRHDFDVFIDARGQRPLKTRDLPFPRLRRQLLAVGEDIPDVGDDYTLQAPDLVRGRIAFAALPFLMHDRPFIQGITASAEIGNAIARAVTQTAPRLRRRWMPLDWTLHP